MKKFNNLGDNMQSNPTAGKFGCAGRGYEDSGDYRKSLNDYDRLILLRAAS